MNKHLQQWLGAIRQVWPLIIGFLMLYVPTYVHLSNTVWRSEEQAHGPLILLIVGYLIYVRREFFLNKEPGEVPRPWIGTLFFLVGLFFYMVGHSQDILIFDLGSQLFVLIGLLLITRGLSAVRVFWFPLFFLIFMMPLPAGLVDAVTMPMKIAVSYVAELVLYGVGYPMARSGVILQIGQYQLLVADACAGLHTLMSLEALGLLYLNIVRSHSMFRNVTLAILIIPISFIANVIRVITLTLITYYFGDAAGQGFMHGFAGMLLFIVALVLILWIDTLLQFFERKWIASRVRQESVLT
ncbi:exosortase B [Methylobacillus sp.]|uniref:exosortase B n=1 Tax=Methylobacillus sp. TaxID=56818 RepID=UPI002FE10E81